MHRCSYVSRKLTEGKTKREAIRCLKRHLVRVIYTTMSTRDMPAATLVLT
jgi:hypothetical protein